MTFNSSEKQPPQVAKILKSYVYVYIDPRNGKPFNVGKDN